MSELWKWVDEKNKPKELVRIGTIQAPPQIGKPLLYLNEKQEEIKTANVESLRMSLNLPNGKKGVILLTWKEEVYLIK